MPARTTFECDEKECGTAVTIPGIVDEDFLPDDWEVTEETAEAEDSDAKRYRCPRHKTAA